MFAFLTFLGIPCLPSRAYFQCDPRRTAVPFLLAVDVIMDFCLLLYNLSRPSLTKGGIRGVLVSLNYLLLTTGYLFFHIAITTSSVTFSSPISKARFMARTM